ncbi:triose-phosphate isomerase [Patescibacteria group bacterium]
MKPNIFLIGQNVTIYSEDGKNQFARTGETSLFHLKKAGATGIILGHSEVRDEPQIINAKWKAALDYDLHDNIVLVGEDWEDLEKGWKNSSQQEIDGMKKKLQQKFLTILEGIDKKHIMKTVFGYEPSWGTRGSGRQNVEPPQPDQIEAMCSFMRKALSGAYGDDIAQKTRIIYGGSSSPERTREIMPSANVDGLILGSACKTTDLVKSIGEGIVQATKEKKSQRKSVIACNWKAYELEEPYTEFIDVITSFDGSVIDAYLSPVASDMHEVYTLLKN